MNGRRAAISLEEAQRRILALAEPMGTACVPLREAIGLRLAEALAADAPIPAFSRSGMDGYALRAADLAGAAPHRPVRLSVVRPAELGHAPGMLRPGEAMRVGTGGQLPAGADTVVMQEAVRLETSDTGAQQAVFLREEAAGRHVTAAGAEAAAGCEVIAAGTRIGPGQAAVLAALGVHTPRVYRKPRVALVTAGDDIVPIDAVPRSGEVRNGNLPMLRALVESAGGSVVREQHVRDEPAHAGDALRRSLHEADIVLSSGGISVGESDVMGALFREAGSGLLFDKLAIRPGSATAAMQVEGKTVIGLSGNPGACFAGFELLVRPVLDKMGGGCGQLLWCGALLAEGSVKSNAYPRFLRGVAWLEDGLLKARPCEENSSSGLVSIGQANALLAIPPSAEETRSGAMIEVRLLPGWEGTLRRI